MQSEERLRDIERLTDLPLMILAILFVPMLLVPVFIDPPESVIAAFDFGEWVIWAIFLVVLVIKIAVASRRVAYLRSNWFEVLVVAVPFLRPLRILRVARVAIVVGVNTSILDRLAANKGLRGIVLTVLVITVSGSARVWLRSACGRLQHHNLRRRPLVGFRHLNHRWLRRHLSRNRRRPRRRNRPHAPWHRRPLRCHRNRRRIPHERNLGARHRTR